MGSIEPLGERGVGLLDDILQRLDPLRFRALLLQVVQPKSDSQPQQQGQDAPDPGWQPSRLVLPARGGVRLRTRGESVKMTR